MLTILTYPDKRLKESCKPVTDFSESLTAFAHDMNESMAAANGIGLAACQVGHMIRLLIVEDSKAPGGFRAFVNPEITFRSDKLTSTEEGCLSIPGVYGYVKRAVKIRVKYQNLQGQKKVEKATGMGAIVLQHEIDHLNGILIIDRGIEYTKGAHLIRTAV